MMQSNELNLGLLDLLDQARDHYQLQLEEQQQSPMFNKLKSAKNLIFGDGIENPNFTNRLIELELNWTETLDQLDLLLDTTIPGLVTLCQDLNGTSKLNRK